MARLWLAVVLVLGAVAAGSAGRVNLPTGVLRGPHLAQFLAAPEHLNTAPADGDLWPQIESWLISAGRKVTNAAADLLGLKHHFDPMEVFAWIPVLAGAARPNASSPTVFSTPCFDSNTVQAIWLDDGGVSVHIQASKAKPCAENGDFYLLGTVEGVRFLEINESATIRVNWAANFTQAERAWVATNGVRLFRFPSSPEKTLQQLLSTVSLFLEPLLESKVSDGAAERNLAFLKLQAYYDMAQREITDVYLPAETINDGDFLGVIRLDGLDPMLGWAMGAHTGHTTVALRFDGELYICESTTKSAYWPTPHVQRTPYDQWLKQAKAASYNVVHLPLSDAARASFNATAAAEWFLSTAEGQPYGFNNLLFGWVDTVNDNYPGALNAEATEMLASIIEHVSQLIGDGIFNAPLNKRLNTSGLHFADLLYVGAQRNLNFSQIANLPEQDAWRYNGTLQMVCDVLVCEVYKAGGIFGANADSVQCTEFTNWDVYTLNIFNSTAPRPEACQVADPDLPFCQILGKHRMSLPSYNTRPIFPHMAEHCPRGVPTNYDKPAGC